MRHVATKDTIIGFINIIISKYYCELKLLLNSMERLLSRKFDMMLNLFGSTWK